MNKVYGLISEFTPVRTEGSRTVISYGKQAVNKENATWNEVYLPVKQYRNIGLKEVKEAIISDINKTTDEKILSGFKYADNDGVERSVWLSSEYQHNFSETHRLAVQQGADAYEPVTFKISEDEDGNAKYRTFATLDELSSFCIAVRAHIRQCQTEGWQEKDNFDWTAYEALYPEQEQERVAGETNVSEMSV